MSATLLSFTRRSPGWDNEELALLIRVQRLLAGAGLDVEMEVGQTEEGDPWCVFCTSGAGDVVIHVARIDGVYILDSSALSAPIEGRSLMHCAERFLAEAPPLVAPAANRGATLYMHPSAMLAGVFMTILIFAQLNAETGGFATISAAEGEETPGEGEGPAAWLRQIAQQVAAFLTSEARNAERNAEQAGPSQNWVMLQSAAMIATLGLSQDDKLLAALLSSGILSDGIALAAPEAAEIAEAEAAAAAPQEASTAETALAGIDEASAAPQTEGGDLFAQQATTPALPEDDATVVAEVVLQEADTILLGSIGADGLLPLTTVSAAKVTALASSPAAIVLTQPETVERPLETSEEALAERVIDALVAAGAREVLTLPDSVRDVLDEIFGDDTRDPFDSDTLDFVTDDPVVEGPVQPVAEDPVSPGGVFGDIGGDAVRQRASEAQKSATGGVADASPHDYAAHLRIDEELFFEIADDVAYAGQRKLSGGNVIYFDNRFSQIADAEDLILLSVEKADSSLLILVTYAVSLDLEDWLVS